MFRKMTCRIALAAAALTSVALPVAAVMPPEGDRVDLAYYDSIQQTGMDQLPTDPYCANPEMLAADLGETYGEDRMLTATRDNGRQFEVWASDSAGTWTVSYTRPDGIACVIGSGIGWDSGDNATARLQEVGLSL